MTGGQRRAFLTLGLPLAVFALRVASAGWEQRDGINPDAVAYLRNALYWTEGRFTDAIAGYWSPMFSWSAVPGMLLGYDALHAARFAIALWGLLLVVLAWLLMRRLLELPVWLETVAMLLVADATLMWATTAWPDIIQAAALLGFTALLWTPSFLDRRGLQVLAGISGGVAYLAKAYAFPFFLLWCPLSIAWRARDRARTLRAWAFAMIGFALVSGPWMAALSVKYGHLTYGTAGALNRAIVGPSPHAAPSWWTPVPGRLARWETPEVIDRGTWSPFDSRAAMRHQIAYSWRIGNEVLASIARFDLLGLALALTLLAPFASAALGRQEESRRLGWIAGTLVLYCAPFVLVYFTYRYTAPLLRPLCVFACFQAAWTLSRRLPPIPSTMLLAGVIVSFAAHVNVPYRPHLVEETGVTPFNDITADGAPHRALAAKLHDVGASGPIASNLDWGGLYVAYFFGAPFVGIPDTPAAQTCEEQLRAHSVRTFLADRSGVCADVLAASASWRRAATVSPASGETIDVYVPVAP